MDQVLVVLANLLAITTAWAIWDGACLARTRRTGQVEFQTLSGCAAVIVLAAAAYILVSYELTFALLRLRFPVLTE